MLFTSQTIASASGSAGGLTASRNRFGMYFRAKTMPVDPATLQQVLARARFRGLAVTWKSLTEVQRELWETYATNTPMQNRLGQTVFLTGFNHFIRSNAPRLQVGLGLLSDAPTIFGLAAFNEATITVVSPTNLAIVFDITDDWVNQDGTALILGISRPQSPTINFFKGPYRVSGFVLGDATTPPTSPAIVVSTFTYTADQKAFGRFRLSLADGRLSGIQTAETIAT